MNESFKIENMIGLENGLLDEIVRRVIEQTARMIDDTIRDLLSRWVSEVEPSLIIQKVRGEPDQILGFGIHGDMTPHPKVIIWAKGMEP